MKTGEWITITIFIDPETGIGKEVNNLLKKSRILKLENKTTSLLCDFFKNALECHYSETEVKTFLSETLLNKNTPEPGNNITDERIEKVISHIRSSANITSGSLIY